MSVFYFFYSIFLFSLFFFLSFYCIYYVYCYGRPALMDDCLHWQPATILICMFNLFVYLANKLSLSQLPVSQESIAAADCLLSR